MADERILTLKIDASALLEALAPVMKRVDALAEEVRILRLAQSTGRT
jgi:hypothetical protein